MNQLLDLIHKIRKFTTCKNSPFFYFNKLKLIKKEFRCFMIYIYIRDIINHSFEDITCKITGNF